MQKQFIIYFVSDIVFPLHKAEQKHDTYNIHVTLMKSYLCISSKTAHQHNNIQPSSTIPRSYYTPFKWFQLFMSCLNIWLYANTYDVTPEKIWSSVFQFLWLEISGIKGVYFKTAGKKKKFHSHINMNWFMTTFMTLFFINSHISHFQVLWVIFSPIIHLKALVLSQGTNVNLKQLSNSWNKIQIINSFDNVIYWEKLGWIQCNFIYLEGNCCPAVWGQIKM